MTNINVISAFKIRAIGCNPDAVAAKEQGDFTPLVLATVMGVVDSLEFGKNDDGSVYVGLCGQFRAENIQEGSTKKGEVFESGRCFLPPGPHERVLAEVRALGLSREGDGSELTDSKKKFVAYVKDGKKLEFAYLLSCKKDGNKRGMTYVCNPLIEPVSNSPLDNLMANARERVKLISAPAAPAPQLEAPAAPEAAPKHKGK